MYGENLGVIDSNTIAYTEVRGLWVATASTEQLIYPADGDYDDTRLAADCANTDFAMSPSGTFLAEPGCSGSPLVRGNADGSGVERLFVSDALGPIPPFYATQFMCVGRDPAGGFFLMLTSAGGGTGNSGPRLFHVNEDATAETGVTEVFTTPSFAEAQNTTLVFPYESTFDECSLAAAPNGTIFLRTSSQLWKVTP